MAKLTSLLKAFIKWVIREKAKHNRALRDILYLIKTIEDFCTKYRLQDDSPNFKTLFEHMGKARIDATEIVYQTGIRIRRFGAIKGKDLLPLVEGMYNPLDELKRSLFTLSLSSEVLTQRVSKLNVAFENLLAAISDIGYK